MEIAGSVTLVTGGNRGFGASSCAALVERGAANVYAGARDIATLTAPGPACWPTTRWRNSPRELDTNVFGSLAMSRAFAPVLAANGGGAMVNVLSVLSWLAAPPNALCCAAKDASWSLTSSLRPELVTQHTQVIAVHVGYMDTDMSARLTVPKSSPDDLARLVLDAVERGDSAVLADDASRRVKAALSGELALHYPAIGS